jgi:hypothetical protein
MAVFRVNKTADYTVMSNFHLRDKRLNLKSKGLLSMVLSLPDDWNYTIGGLVAICRESESAVKSALNELKKYGYLRIDKVMPNKENGGRYEYIYNIFEQPPKKQAEGIQGVENQPLENQTVENNPLYKDTYLSNTDIQNTDISSKNKKKERKPTGYDEILSNIPDDDLRELYIEYIKMRKLIKSPMTDRALTMLIKKVNELESSTERQKMLLETAIMNNWKSVYPLKDEKGTGKPAPAGKPDTSNPFLDILREQEGELF